MYLNKDVATDATTPIGTVESRMEQVRRELSRAQLNQTPSCSINDQQIPQLANLLGQALSKIIHPEYKSPDYPTIRKLIVQIASVFVSGHASPEAAAVLAAYLARSLPVLDDESFKEELALVSAQDAYQMAGLYQVDIVPFADLMRQLKVVLDDPAFYSLLKGSSDNDLINTLNDMGKAQWPMLEMQIKDNSSNKRSKAAQEKLGVLLKELEDEGVDAKEQCQRVFHSETLGLLADLNPNDANLEIDVIARQCPTVTKRDLKNALEATLGERHRLRIEGQPRNRPLIKVPMKDRDLLAKTLASLNEYNLEKNEVFVMSGKLARIVRDETGKPRIELLLKADQISHLLSESIDFFKMMKKGKLVEWTPSPKLVGDMLSVGQYPLPAIKGITQVPVLRTDGSVLTIPGYDSETGLYYAPDPKLDLPEIPEDPSPEQVNAAVQFINEELFVDFPFSSEADHANAWAELLTVFMRDLISDCVPAMLHDAPSAGTGKSLLARLTSMVVTGNDAGLLPQPENEAEMRKLLTAELIQGGQLIVLDNYDGKLDSPILCKLITSGEHQDRILGKSTTVTLAMNALPIITMNNCEVGGDMARRVVLIRMDARQAKPWERDSQKFRHADLIGWVKQNRGEVLVHLLTIGSAWLKAGSPPPSKPRSFGSFQQWIEVIGGVLEFSGIPGFLENMDVVANMVDSDTPQVEGFLMELYAHMRKSPLTPFDQTASQWKEFIDRGGDILKNQLPDELADGFETSQPGLTRTLGRWFKRNKDRRFGEHGLRIEEAGKHRNSIVWRLAWDSEPKINGLFVQSADGATQRLGSAPQVEQEVK